jgi:hypothetical protein
VLAYLDDVTLGGEAEVVAKGFEHLERMAAGLRLSLNRLSLNRAKCEIIGLTPVTRVLFQSLGILFPETPISEASLLGAPLSSGAHLDTVLEEKRNELQTLASRLPFLPAHDSLYLLRNVLTAPRLVYLLRTAPCTGSAVLPQYDALLQQTVTTTLNVDLSDRAWSQATLPVRWGGIGIRDVVSLAPSAYLASAASTMDLVTRLLPPRLHGTIDSGYEVAFASWSLLTGSIQSSIHSSQSSSQSQLHPMAQRSWDEPCCQTRADELLNTATDQVDRARLLASRSEGSGDWLGALPLSCIGLKMDNAATRIAVGLRLGSPLVRGHKCVCGTAVSVDGHHGLDGP